MEKYVIIDTLYGKCSVRKSRINNKLTINSALNKNEFFRLLFKEKQFELSKKINILSDLVDLRTKILVENKYGICEIYPQNLLRGYIPSILSAVNKTVYFINEAKEIHGDKYDYSKVNYISSENKVEIFCNKCNNYFYQQPNNHLQGQDCSCRKIQKIKDKQKSSIEEFIKKGCLIHNNKYNYSNVNYINARKKVEIICPIHGSFLQTPNSHLSKCGCKKCSDSLSSYYWTSEIWEEKAKLSKEFDSFKFYIIKCWNENETFYKIGKTYKKISKRFYKNNLAYNYEIINFIKGTSKEITDMEINFKQEFKNFNYRPKIKFGGFSECYTKYE